MPPCAGIATHSPPPPHPTPSKKAAISHTIPSCSDPSNHSSWPSSRVIGVVGGMKWWAVGELALVWSYVMILKGLGAVVLAMVEGGCGWDVSFVPNPSHPSKTGHSKATLQLNGENGNAPLENSGQWESPSNGSSPCSWKGGSRVNVMQQTEWAQRRHQHTLTCTPDSLAALLHPLHTCGLDEYGWFSFLLSKVATYSLAKLIIWFDYRRLNCCTF